MTTQKDFFNQIKQGAIKGWKTHKVLPSISLAQAALESAWGKSELATKGNNLFGIKGNYNGDSITIKTSEFINGEWVKVDAKFKKYPSWNESIEDHGTFFTSGEWRKTNYKAVIGETDYKKAAKALQSSGYATDPTYADKLIKLIEEYKLNEWGNLKEENINMTTFLVIDGHGENKDRSFDPGATGLIKKGEHKYFEENFFPAVKKYLPKDSNVVLFSEYNVYDYKNLVTLADKYGKNTVVIEMHYDAGSSSASGGHVIVHAAYAPDKYDLAIRDVIKKHIGVRYEHKGQKGISGRDNLGNCNRAKSAGLNYRLVELGFGTNAKDAATMVDNVDAIAKDFVQALIGKVNDKPITVAKPVAKPVVSKPAAKSIDQLANEVIAGKHGSGDARRKALGSQFDAVQAKVNQLLGAKTVVKAPVKTVQQLATETLAGKHGNGDARKKSLGSNYNAVMNIINGKTVAKKSVDTIAREVIAGKFGNGTDRKKNIEKAGYNYNEVQKRVNQLF